MSNTLPALMPMRSPTCGVRLVQEIVFYSIPTEKEATAGIKPELLKRFPSGHEETIKKVLLLDVDKVTLKWYAGGRRGLVETQDA